MIVFSLNLMGEMQRPLCRESNCVEDFSRNIMVAHVAQGLQSIL